MRNNFSIGLKVALVITILESYFMYKSGFGIMETGAFDLLFFLGWVMVSAIAVGVVKTIYLSIQYTVALEKETKEAED